MEYSGKGYIAWPEPRQTMGNTLNQQKHVQSTADGFSPSTILPEYRSSSCNKVLRLAQRVVFLVDVPTQSRPIAIILLEVSRCQELTYTCFTHCRIV